MTDLAWRGTVAILRLYALSDRKRGLRVSCSGGIFIVSVKGSLLSSENAVYDMGSIRKQPIIFCTI